MPNRYILLIPSNEYEITLVFPLHLVSKLLFERWLQRGLIWEAHPSFVKPTLQENVGAFKHISKWQSGSCDYTKYNY